MNYLSLLSIRTITIATIVY